MSSPGGGDRAAVSLKDTQGSRLGARPPRSISAIAADLPWLWTKQPLVLVGPKSTWHPSYEAVRVVANGREEDPP